MLYSASRQSHVNTTTDVADHDSVGFSRAGGIVTVVQLSPDEIITATAAVSFDHHGRLAATIEVQTPFIGYTSMMLKFVNKPDTTAERSLLNFQVSSFRECINCDTFD